MIQLQSHNSRVNIIYALTADKFKREIEDFFGNLKAILQTTRKSNTTVILVYFNANIVEEKVDQCVEDFGLGMNAEINW